MQNHVAVSVRQALVGDVTRMKTMIIVAQVHCSIGCDDATCKVSDTAWQII